MSFVVLAGVEGRDVVVLVLFGAVVLSTDLVYAAFCTAARAVLPHGNSAGVVRKKETHHIMKSRRHDL